MSSAPPPPLDPLLYIIPILYIREYITTIVLSSFLWALLDPTTINFQFNIENSSSSYSIFYTKVFLLLFFRDTSSHLSSPKPTLMLSFITLLLSGSMFRLIESSTVPATSCLRSMILPAASWSLVYSKVYIVAHFHLFPVWFWIFMCSVCSLI